MNDKDTGILLSPQNIKLHRLYFKQMVKLLGIQLQYYAPRESKQYDLHGELETNYYEPITVGCIYQGEVTQSTAKKLG